MKLNYDQARFELYSYRLNDLIEKYEKIGDAKRCSSIILWNHEEIDKDGLSAIDVSYEKFGRNRQVEEDCINGEIDIINEFRRGFNEALQLIYEGTAERLLVDEENW